MSGLLKSDVVDYTLTKSVLHVGDSKNAHSHVEYWHEIFRANKTSVLFLVRNIIVFRQLQASDPLLSICYAKSPLNVEELLNNIKTLKTVFYSGNTGNNIHLLRFNEYKHIYIGSKHSERLATLTKYRRVYDSIWISGSQEEKKYKDSNMGLFDVHRVGKPTLQPLLQKISSIDLTKKENILYLIDSQSSAASSMHLSGDIIRLLNNHCVNLSVLVNENFEQQAELHRCFKDLCDSLMISTKVSSYFELGSNLSGNHAIIADVSLFSLEMLALGCPIILYYDKKKHHLSDNDLEYYAGFDFCYKFENTSELEIVLNNLKNEDTLLKLREAKIDALIGRKETLENHFLGQLKLNKLTH